MFDLNKEDKQNNWNRSADRRQHKLGWLWVAGFAMYREPLFRGGDHVDAGSVVIANNAIDHATRRFYSIASGGTQHVGRETRGDAQAARAGGYQKWRLAKA
jgi:hypothetical protein